MNPLTREWVDKAEGDLHTLERERRARKAPNFDAAAFRAQQCAEKYVKALLHEWSIPFPFTHDVELLLTLALQKEPQLLALVPAGQALTQHAVKARYPGSTVTRAQAHLAARQCIAVRGIIRALLKLGP